MSYAQGTTHYNFPQIAGTDRPTFADANEAFRTLDTKIYSLEGSATDVDGRLDTAEGNIVQLQGDVQTAQGTADLAKSTADSAVEQIGITNTNVSQLTTRVGNKFDSVGIADPYDTAATYAVGDVVTYNGQRYRCTTAVTVAEPFDVTKWTGEDVETVLDEIKSDLTYSTDTILASNNANLLNDVLVKRFGKVVSLRFRGVKNLGTSSTETLFTLPAEYRPTDVEYYSVLDNSGVEKYIFNVDTNGVVSVTSATTTGNQNHAQGTFTFIK